jgi:hypothetical protein
MKFRHVSLFSMFLVTILAFVRAMSGAMESPQALTKTDEADGPESGLPKAKDK